FHGAMRLGAVWVGVNRVLAPPEKRYLLDDAGATLLLADDPGADLGVRAVGGAEWRAALAAAPAVPAGAEAWAAVLRAIASSPSHPLLLAVAVEIAKKSGAAEDVPTARAKLMAVARTPAERALAAE
ncbi:MAG TPA: hypothetical protein VM925_26970, partial [Labilithrix sp.]|nr:hypothetical protein [Labilithrix sp.]